jgi:hypothetical protein
MYAYPTQRGTLAAGLRHIASVVLELDVFQRPCFAGSHVNVFACVFVCVCIVCVLCVCVCVCVCVVYCVCVCVCIVCVYCVCALVFHNIPAHRGAAEAFPGSEAYHIFSGLPGVVFCHV